MTLSEIKYDLERAYNLLSHAHGMFNEKKTKNGERAGDLFAGIFDDLGELRGILNKQ